MNLEIGQELIWIKGDNFEIIEKVHSIENGLIYFESNRSIFSKLVTEFMINIEDYVQEEYENVVINKSDFIEDFTISNTISNNNNTNLQVLNKDEFSLLFKGKNLINKNIKLDLNLKVPTDFIIKGLLSAYGLSEIEPSLIYMIKNQIIENLDIISENIIKKLTTKIKK